MQIHGLGWAVPVHYSMSYLGRQAMMRRKEKEATRKPDPMVDDAGGDGGGSGSGRVLGACATALSSEATPKFVHAFC